MDKKVNKFKFKGKTKKKRNLINFKIIKSESCKYP